MIDQRVRKLTPEFMTYTLAKMGLWAMTHTTAQALAPVTSFSVMIRSSGSDSNDTVIRLVENVAAEGGRPTR